MRITFLIVLLFSQLAGPAFLQGQSNADELINQAEIQYRTLDFEAGLATLDALLLRQSKSEAGQHSRPKSKLTAWQLARVHCFRGECLFELGRETEARRAFLEAWRHYETAAPYAVPPPFSFRIPQGLQVLSPDYESWEHWRRKLDEILLQSEADHPEVLAASFYYQALDTAYAGYYPQAIGLLKASADQLGQLEYSQIDLFSTYNFISTLYELSGDDASALLYQQLCLAQCSRKRPEQYFRTLLNVAGFHLDLRQEAACRSTLVEAKQLADENGLADNPHWPMYYATAYELYNLLPRLDSMEQVIARQTRFYEQYPAYKQESGYAHYLNQKAGIYIRKQAYDAALPYVNEAIARADSEHGNTSRFLLSKVRCGQGDFEAAISLLHELSCDYFVGGDSCAFFPQDTVFRVRDLRDDFTLIAYLKDKASYYKYWFDQDPQPKLLELSRANVALADSLLNQRRAEGRFRGSSRRIDEISAELRKVEIANLYAGLDRSPGDQLVEYAFNCSEKVKQLAISERLHGQLMSQDFGLPPHVIEQERGFIDQLTDLLNQSKTALDSVAAVGFVQRIDSIRKAQLDLQAHIREEYPNYYNLLFSPEPLVLADIRQHLIGPNEVLLQYLEQGKHVFLVVVNQEEANFLRLEQSEPLAKLLPRLRHLMRERSDEVFPLLRTLYKRLVAPAEEWIGERDLVIIPDGQLWYLPFAALLKQAAPATALSSEQEYLILEHDIRYLISGRVAFLQSRVQRSGTSGSRGILAMSPLASDGLGRFEQLSQSDSSLLLLQQLSNSYHDHFFRDQQASLVNFKAWGPTAALLHLGTHAVVDNERPESSFFVFNNHNPNEEFTALTAESIYGMEFSAQLGVLSACRTGDGKLRRGQGVANLARAFAYAGCRNLVVNLWEVQDGVAKDIMQSFYPALLNEKIPTATAYNAAQRNYARSAKRNGHPANWAMGVYVGNNEVLELNNQISPFWIIGLGLCGLLVCAWLLFKTVRSQA